MEIPRWCIGYVKQTHISGFSWEYELHMILSGSDVFIASGENPAHWTGWFANYNSRDNILYYADGGVELKTISIGGGLIYPADYEPLHVDMGTLISKNMFVGVSNGQAPCWVNVSTGKKLADISLAPNSVLSTLDSVTNNVFMFVGGSPFLGGKLVAVTPNTDTVVKEWPVFPTISLCYPPTRAWNHGNFICTENNTEGTVNYEMMYVENINHPMNQMIIEMN
jgi:hypothetical protein